MLEWKDKIHWIGMGMKIHWIYLGMEVWAAFFFFQSIKQIQPTQSTKPNFFGLCWWGLICDWWKRRKSSPPPIHFMNWAATPQLRWPAAKPNQPIKQFHQLRGSSKRSNWLELFVGLAAELLAPWGPVQSIHSSSLIAPLRLSAFIPQSIQGRMIDFTHFLLSFSSIAFIDGLFAPFSLFGGALGGLLPPITPPKKEEPTHQRNQITLPPRSIKSNFIWFISRLVPQCPSTTSFQSIHPFSKNGLKWNEVCWMGAAVFQYLINSKATINFTLLNLCYALS